MEAGGAPLHDLIVGTVTSEGAGAEDGEEVFFVAVLDTQDLNVLEVNEGGDCFLQDSGVFA